MITKYTQTPIDYTGIKRWLAPIRKPWDWNKQAKMILEYGSLARLNEPKRNTENE